MIICKMPFFFSKNVVNDLIIGVEETILIFCTYLKIYVTLNLYLKNRL